MRAELPWNVAGIPPEAREAARAAARREGLSVGEWLTRRIIAELGEDAAIPTTTGAVGPELVAGANRQTEDMLARLAQAEAEASSTYRRIEEQLRNVGSGLDNAERSQSESHRAMSRAASEITLASHEQTQAFDELGRHIISLDERVEKVERAAQQDGFKEAVKGLHQGLSRLADQFGQASSRSGVQVSSLARNLEQLALRLVQARADADSAAQALLAHIAQMEEAHHNTATGLDRVVERLGAEAAARDQDRIEIAARETDRQIVLNRLEERIARLEEPDRSLEQRLEAIEQSLSAVLTDLERPDPRAALAEDLREISFRLESLEQNHTDMLAELQSGLARIPPPASEVVAKPADVAEAPFEAPAVEAVAEDFLPIQPVSVPEEPSVPEPVVPAAEPADNFVQHAFATHFDMPKDFAEALAQPAPPSEQDILVNARELARAAAEEDAGRGLMGFKRGEPLRDEAKKSRLNFLIVLAVVFFLLLAAAVALMLSERFAVPAQSAPPNHARAMPKHVAMANPSAVTFVPKLEVAQPLTPPAATATASDKDVTLAPAPVDFTSPPAAAVAPSSAVTPPAGKVQAAAIGGNATAEAIVGLKYLDEDDPGKALPWLRKAAEAGQPVAQYRLGTVYERGQGVAANPELAAKWYLAASNQGNRKAMHNLAVAYAEGTIGRKDMQEAARWFANAAALGLSDSQFNLAVLYERGDGVPQSLAEAYKWYAIAAAAGDAESKTRLQVLKTQLSDAERTAAEHAAQAFHAEALDRLANVPPTTADIGG